MNRVGIVAVDDQKGPGSLEPTVPFLIVVEYRTNLWINSLSVLVNILEVEPSELNL
jgi:hypothetical protein